MAKSVKTLKGCNTNETIGTEKSKNNYTLISVSILIFNCTLTG